jgi:hypothetical protein
MSYYYLYLIKFEDGRFYIGSRKSKVPANEDVNYWGSPGKINKHLWEMQKEKHILLESIDISLQDLRKKERILIEEGWRKFGREKCINKTLGGLDSIPIELHIETGKLSGKKTYELGVGIHALTLEQRIENGKVYGHIGGKKSKELGVGIHSLTKEQQIENGKKSIKTQKELGIGIYGISKEQREKMIKKSIKTQKELGIGIYGISKEQREKNGKKGYVNGLANLTKEHRKEISKKAGKITAKIHKENNTGFYGLSKEERIRNSKNSYQNGLSKFEKEFSLKSPTGNIITGKNIAKFCRENNLSPQNVGKVLFGKRKSHKGWTKP